MARGHAFLYGRNYIEDVDLKVVIPVALSSAPKERVQLFKLLLENNGQLNTSQFMEKAKVSRDTALKSMKQLTMLDLVESVTEQNSTKPTFAVKLKEHYQWFLTDEFRKCWES